MITEEKTIEEEKDEIKFNLDSFFGHIKDYAEERLNLVVLNLTDKVSKTVSGIGSVLVVTIFSIFALVFLSTALAWWIGQSLDSPALGFLIVGVFYVLLAIVLFANRDKWIYTPVANAFIKQLTIDEDDEGDDKIRFGK